MNDGNYLLNRNQKINIYSAGNVILSALIIGILEIIPMISNWVAGLTIVVIGIIIVFIINIKKFGLIKNEKIVTLRRAVIIDGLLLAFSFISNWFFIFVPEPFTWDEFLNAKPTYNFHIGIIIIGIVLMIPTILTNKLLKNVM